MNEGGENDQVLLWENNVEWLFFNLNDHQVGSREMFEGEKLPDPNRFDTPLTVVKNVAEASIDVGKKRSPPNQKKGGNRSGEPKSGVDGGGVRRGESTHKIQIWTKRARRKKIRNMFKSLHALLPQLPGKAKGGNNLAQFSEAFTVEDMYKLATTEIMSLATPDDRY